MCKADDAEVCSDHGDCIDQTCFCDMGWFGEDCNDNGSWGSTWTAYIATFLVCYFALLLYSFYRFQANFSVDKGASKWQKVCRIYKSPKRLSLFLFVVFTLLRIVWLATDPLRYRELNSRLIDRLLFEGAFPFLYCIFCSIFLVFAAMYQLVRGPARKYQAVMTKTVCVSMLFAFPLAVASAVCKGLRVESRAVEWLGYLFGGLYLVIILSAFLSFGIMLCRLIRQGSLKKNVSTGYFEFRLRKRKIKTADSEQDQAFSSESCDLLSTENGQPRIRSFLFRGEMGWSLEP